MLIKPERQEEKNLMAYISLNFEKQVPARILMTEQPIQDVHVSKNEPQPDKPIKWRVPSEDTDQPRHPHRLISLH